MAKQLSKGTTFEIEVGSTWTHISGVKDFSGLNGGTSSIIDATDLDSTAKEKLPGLPDEGSIDLTMDYMPTDAGQLALDATRTANTGANIRVTAPTGKQWSFLGLVLSTEKSGQVDQLMQMKAKIEISGPVTVGTAS